MWWFGVEFMEEFHSRANVGGDCNDSGVAEWSIYEKLSEKE